MNINLQSPAIIFYNDIKESDHENGIWALSVDIKCEHCGKLQPYVAYHNKCAACRKSSDFKILKFGNQAICFIGKENAQRFQDEFDSVLVAAIFAEYNEPRYYLRVYGDNPLLQISFTKGKKEIKLYIFIERQDDMFGGAIKYGCSVSDANGALDDNYLEIIDFSLVLERARRNM